MGGKSSHHHDHKHHGYLPEDHAPDWHSQPRYHTDAQAWGAAGGTHGGNEWTERPERSNAYQTVGGEGQERQECYAWPYSPGDVREEGSSVDGLGGNAEQAGGGGGDWASDKGDQVPREDRFSASDPSKAGDSSQYDADSNLSQWDPREASAEDYDREASCWGQGEGRGESSRAKGEEAEDTWRPGSEPEEGQRGLERRGGPYDYDEGREDWRDDGGEADDDLYPQDYGPVDQTKTQVGADSGGYYDHYQGQRPGDWATPADSGCSTNVQSSSWGRAGGSGMGILPEPTSQLAPQGGGGIGYPGNAALGGGMPVPTDYSPNLRQGGWGREGQGGNSSYYPGNKVTGWGRGQGGGGSYYSGSPSTGSGGGQQTRGAGSGYYPEPPESGVRGQAWTATGPTSQWNPPQWRPVKYHLHNMEVKVRDGMFSVKSSVNDTYPEIIMAMAERQQLLTFYRVPREEKQIGVLTTKVPYVAIFRDRLETEPALWNLQVVKTKVKTQFKGVVSCHVDTDISAVYAALDEKSAEGSRLICVEYSAGKRRLLLTEQLMMQGPEMGLDVLFEVPTQPTAQRYVYETIAVPIEVTSTFLASKAECNWMAAMRSKLIEGWKLVEIFYDNSDYVYQHGLDFHTSITSLWIFEKPESRRFDTTPFWEGCYAHHEVEVQYGALKTETKKKEEWEGLLEDMGRQGWELACLLEIPKRETIKFRTKLHMLFFFQRPIHGLQPLFE